MLCVLNAYEKESIANINFENLAGVNLSREKMRKYINMLVEEGHVINLSKNGFFPKYQILTKVECPNFLFDKTLQFNNKLTLMYAMKALKSYDYIPAKQLSREVFGKEGNEKRFYQIKTISGKDVFTHLKNLEFVKRTATHDKYELIETRWGMQVLSSPKKEIYEYRCQYCGESNPDNFAVRNATTCKKCTYENRKKKLLECPEKLLLSRVKLSSNGRAKVKYVTITENDIKDQLIKQNYKDYYTGCEMKVDMMSVDRLDSDKHYEVGNIVITDRYINCMKNDLSIIEFKNYITNLYNNLENF